MKQTINIRTDKKCAFCKYWYDPTNSAIIPKSTFACLWEIKDVNQKSSCIKRNVQTLASSLCFKYECKL